MISNRPHLFTSESVTEGHPDKMADQISDAILDAILQKDPNARVAVETLLKTGLCVLAGEIRTDAKVDFENIARKKIKEIGYTSSKIGFDFESCTFICAVDEQSKNIAQGVDASGNKEQGAGDQGLMFGFACDETPELMPLPITLANKLAKRLSDVRKDGTIPFLLPDGKSQVTTFYEDGVPKFLDSVVISSQHEEGVPQEKVRDAIIDEVIKKVIPENYLPASVKYHINPTGEFVIGGPAGDAGLTGRKIIIDTYGGMGRHGGGAFSGKDPSKVDRSAAYMARYIAKNIVAAKLAKQCEVQLSYAIGMSEPTSLMVNTFGTSNIDEEKIEKAVREVAPLKPGELIDHLQLCRPIYAKTAAYGHFGRNDSDFSWEKLDLVNELKKRVL